MSLQIPWSSHRLLLRDVTFEGWLVNETPLRIGAGRDSPLGSAVDLAVLRILISGRSVPYIPGSSLKGVFRSTAVQLARAKRLSVCSGLSGDTCMDWDNPKLSTTLHRYIQEALRSREESFEAIKVFHSEACLLCKVFGAPSFTGHAEFSDAYPFDEHGRLVDVPVGVRTGIAIDRRTGAVRRGGLYTVEFVEPGARFKFSIRSTNLPNYALGLLAKIVRGLNEGWVKIGGFKTRGFGKVRVEGLSFTAYLPYSNGTMLPAVDDVDKDVDLSNLVEVVGKQLRAPSPKALQVLQKLEEVWDNANFTESH
ncbi:MAG: CRISPR-associated RAMP protein Csx7 [Thermofilaceae archaeon]|nr:CRISPR-associated RAMP protein Csx7 [Thermofilaceae archaeon]MDW8004931.1 CRISPR-associated RAMP protein Csx7 [Thermofilaceae archaeon]